MLFFVRHKDREFRVRVESRRGQTFIKFDDGAEEPIDMLFFGNDCSLITEGKVFYANVSGQKSAYTVWRPEGNMPLTVESEYRRIVNVLRGQDIGDENNVYAKMPGKIVKIFTKKGDTVERGASVIVMEAMKMENEIRTTVAGTIKNLCVSEGQAVETGTLLVEIDPTEE